MHYKYTGKGRSSNKAKYTTAKRMMKNFRTMLNKNPKKKAY